MVRHLLYRLTGAALVLLAVSFVTFVALSWTPGDAAQGLAGDSASAEQLDALRADLGLGQPLPVRYAAFLRGLAHGDLGSSLVSGRPVAGLIGERLPYTAGLAVLAILLAAVLGTVLGVAAAVRAGSVFDTALMSATLAGLAMPGFWLALLLTLFFSLKLRWFPVVGAEGAVGVGFAPRHAGPADDRDRGPVGAGGHGRRAAHRIRAHRGREGRSRPTGAYPARVCEQA